MSQQQLQQQQRHLHCAALEFALGVSLGADSVFTDSAFAGLESSTGFGSAD